MEQQGQTMMSLSQIDFQNSLYLHPSDTPGAVIVSQQLTGIENYSHSSRAMIVTLTGKNKIGFINGSCTKSNLDSSLHSLWETRQIVSRQSNNEVTTALISTNNANKGGNYKGKKLLIIREHCNNPGHKKNKCWNLYGYPEGHKFYKPKGQFGTKGNKTTNPASANISTSNNSQEQMQIQAPVLTIEQYNNLFKLLGKENTQPSANLADDILLTRDDLVGIEHTKPYPASKFHIKDLGTLKFFLGLEIARSDQGICIDQHKYALEFISEAGLSSTKPTSIPMEQNTKLTSFEYDNNDE
ncbi:uncharacterized protein LOC116126906 [Pistacia vera]|uniref:uncharacterized protein LOC116126906 n=1 Tax=Pistacia vera TaxID=55513 RepID=UPI001263759A|nr:uncharacterized protein LOC116126906 [Pistacia vera]